MLKTLEQAKQLYTRAQAFCNRILSHIFQNKLVQYLSFKFFSLSKKNRIFIIIFLVFCSWFIYSKCIFRFENFGTNDELREYLYRKFPIGSKGVPLILALKKAGAHCELSKDWSNDRYVPKDAKEQLYCEYSHFEFSWHLIIDFTLGVYFDDKGNIVRITSGRYPAAF